MADKDSDVDIEATDDKKRTMGAEKAGINFSTSRAKKHLKGKIERVSKDAGVFLAAVGEYLISELIDISVEARKKELGVKRADVKETKNSKKADSGAFIIQPRNVTQGLREDKDLKKLFDGATIEGGDLPVMTTAELKSIYHEDGEKKKKKKKKVTFDKESKKRKAEPKEKKTTKKTKAEPKDKKAMPKKAAPKKQAKKQKA